MSCCTAETHPQAIGRLSGLYGYISDAAASRWGGTGIAWRTHQLIVRTIEATKVGDEGGWWGLA